MKCLDNMERITLATDTVMNMIKIYQFKGIEFYYRDYFEDDIESMSQQTIEKETIYLSKLFKIELSEQRKKLLLKRDAVAKNKDEVIFLNIKNAFVQIHKDVNGFEYNPNQYLDMAKFLFKNVNDVNVCFDTYTKIVNRNSLIPEKKTVSMRDDFEQLLNKYSKMLKSEGYELTLLITNFYVDFINTKPFKVENDKIGIIMLYILLFKEGFELFRYTSFFELVYEYQSLFEQNLLQAGFNWDKGFSQTSPLHQLILNILLRGYQNVEQLLREYQIDSAQNKSDNIENTINKLGELFTKDDIRLKHPYVSESTINRTLKRMRDQGLIRPLGVGRSAKWLKLYNNTEVDYQQLRLFDEKN